MNLSPPGQEPLIVETFLLGAFCPGNLITGVVLPVKQGHQREGPTLHSPAGPSASGEGEVPGEQPRSWGLV